MIHSELQLLAKEQGIDVTTALHEKREIQFLEQIVSDPVLALHLAFKGGTALRLVYLSDRYSDDLDFDLIGKNPPSTEEVFDLLMKIVDKQGLEVVDSKVKRSTILIAVREPGWKRRLKIEVSHLPYPKGIPTVVKNVVTPVYSSSVNVLTYPLPVLFSGKILAVIGRKNPTPRDLYDLFWFLSHRVEENTEYLCAFSDDSYRDKKKLYEKLISCVDKYPDKQIVNELCTLLPRRRREWVRGELKERTKELLELKLSE